MQTDNLYLVLFYIASVCIVALLAFIFMFIFCPTFRREVIEDIKNGR